MSPQNSPQPVYELTRQRTAPDTDAVEDLLRRALAESEKAFTEGASLRALGNMDAGARSYIKAIGVLESAVQLSLGILQKRRSA